MISILNLTSALMLLSVVTQAVPAKRVVTVKKNVVFEVILEDGIKNKPFLMVYGKGIDHNDMSHTGEKEMQPSSIKDNSYVFELKDQLKPLYFSLLLNDTPMDLTIAREFHFEPGDHVKIEVKKTNVPNIYDLNFSGVGSAKYKCQNEFRNAARMDSVKTPEVFLSDNTYNPNNQSIRYTQLVYGLIEKYRPEMSDYSYNLLHADVLGSFGNYLYFSLSSALFSELNKKDTVGFKQTTKDFLGKYKADAVSGIPDSVLTDSKEYSNFILEKIKTEVLMDFATGNNNIVFERIKRTTNPTLRDKMIVSFFRNNWSRLNDSYESVLNEAIAIVKDKEDKKTLLAFDRHSAGRTAFNFSLTDVNDKKVRLSDFKGKNVFIDFWFNGCPHCESYYKWTVSKVEKKYEENPNIIFITVSVDKSKDKWLEGLNSGNYTSISKNVINLYTNGEGVNNELIKYYNIAGYPSPMLIGKKGEIIKFSGTGLRKIEILTAEIAKAL